MRQTAFILIILSLVCFTGLQCIKKDDPSGGGTGTGTSTGSGALHWSWDPNQSIDYIITNQNSDGTWMTGLQVNPDHGRGITVGTTALACMALLDYWDYNPTGIRPVIEKGLAACIDKVWRSPDYANDFDSTAWGHSFTVQLLARLIRHPDWTDNAQYKTDAEEILGWFYMRQRSSGGWGYSSSFQTGASVITLKELKDAGVMVDETRYGRGVSFLKSLHCTWGIRYSQGQSEASLGSLGSDGALDDCAGRLGVSGYALYIHQEISQGTLDDLMQKFINHRDYLWTTRLATASGVWTRNGGCSPYAYFAFFGYLYSARALEGVSDSKKSGWAQKIGDDLMLLRQSNNTWLNFPWERTISAGPGFQDNIEPGSRIYATAMAMMAFRYLDGIMGGS